jgi:hypothetical protein
MRRLGVMSAYGAALVFHGEMGKARAKDSAAFTRLCGTDSCAITPMLAGKPLTGDDAKRSRNSYSATWTKQARKLLA